jgi:hypothetical protein
MKTLQEYILEAMSKDVFLDNVKSMFGIKNDDYEFAYNILKSANSTKGLLDGLENYIKGEKEIKTTGYYLAMLFDLSGLDVEDNKQIITSIIRNNNENELNAMVDALSDKMNDTKQQSLKFDFTNGTGNLLNDFCNNFKDLAKYIFNIKDFKKSGNTAGIGPGELLLQLLIGGNETHVSGDVGLPDGKILEVKSKNGKLGNSEINSTKTTKFFINKLINKNNGYNIELKYKINDAEIPLSSNEIEEYIDRNGSCFGGTRADKDGGIKKFNAFWQDITLNYKNNIKIEDLKTEIFKCYIETIFDKYGYNKFDKNLLTILENPFEIDNNNTLKIYKSKTDFIPLTGFLYLYAYQQSTGFNYLIVFDENFNFKCLDCEKILEKYDNITKKFSFTLPGNTNDKSSRSNVASINLKK